MLKNRKKFSIKNLVGVAILLLGFTTFLIIYWPIIIAKIKQGFYPIPSTNQVVISESDTITKEIKKETEKIEMDKNFGLYIPKIKSNASVVQDVNPYIYEEYTKALERGIAHAKGTATPDKKGNVFLFAHSAVNFYERNKYNVYFYLLNDLSIDDEIYVSYNGIIYRYKVREVKIVNKDQIEYLNKNNSKDILTLMTCYPAGTDWKRTVVIAQKDLQTTEKK